MDKLILNRNDLNKMDISREKKSNFVKIRVSIHQKDTTVIINYM